MKRVLLVSTVVIALVCMGYAAWATVAAPVMPHDLAMEPVMANEVGDSPLYAQELARATTDLERPPVRHQPRLARANNHVLDVSPTAQQGVSTCDTGIWTCDGGGTCDDSATCTHYNTCAYGVWTCMGYPTCDGTNTCNYYATCSHQNTCGTVMTCSQEYTCTGWQPAPPNTCDAQQTCGGDYAHATCDGNWTCLDDEFETCDQDMATCQDEVTCNEQPAPPDHTCHGYETCRAGSETCEEDTCQFHDGCDTTDTGVETCDGGGATLACAHTCNEYRRFTCGWVPTCCIGGGQCNTVVSAGATACPNCPTYQQPCTMQSCISYSPYFTYCVAICTVQNCP